MNYENAKACSTVIKQLFEERGQLKDIFAGHYGYLEVFPSLNKAGGVNLLSIEDYLLPYVWILSTESIINLLGKLHSYFLVGNLLNNNSRVFFNIPTLELSIYFADSAVKPDEHAVHQDEASRSSILDYFRMANLILAKDLPSLQALGLPSTSDFALENSRFEAIKLVYDYTEFEAGQMEARVAISKISSFFYDIRRQQLDDAHHREMAIQGQRRIVMRLWQQVAAKEDCEVSALDDISCSNADVITKPSRDPG